MNRKKLNQICDKILNGQSWQYCKFGEWIIGDGLSPRYCVQQGHEIRLAPLPIKSRENCKNWESGVNLHDDEQLATVTEQRDEAREELAELKAEYGTWWAQKRIAIDELKEVTAQRDEARRLAERYRDLSCDTVEKADETLLPWEITNPNEL